MERLYLLILIILVGWLVYWHHLRIIPYFERHNEHMKNKDRKRKYKHRPSKHVTIKDDISIDSLDSTDGAQKDKDSVFTE